MISVLNQIIKKRYFFTSIFSVIGLFLWLLTPRYIQLEGQSFGTYYKVTVFAPRIAVRSATLSSALQNELSRLNYLYSTYIDDSELAKFNQNFSSDPIFISEDLHALFQFSDRWYQKLHGAWDPTLGALSRYYGLQPSGSSIIGPSSTGFDTIQVLPNGFIQKTRPMIEVDFSSNAKGLAVDRVSSLLNTYWVYGTYVDIGGEVRTTGHKQSKLPWRIGIQNPSDSGIISIIQANDIALATSGNYLNYINIEGQSIGHILDPRYGGGPVSHKLLSVTVIASDCLTADTLATGLFVMGEIDAKKWLKNYPEFPVLLVTEDALGAQVHHYINGIDQYFLERDRPLLYSDA
ncbi:MAG: FAD:protein FMN transferase [Candidatus Marinamargulisbacteria bacterium]